MREAAAFSRSATLFPEGTAYDTGARGLTDPLPFHFKTASIEEMKWSTEQARAGELEQYVAQVLARQISEDLKKAGEKHACR